MELLKSIGLNEKDIRRVSVETADSIKELESLASYVDGDFAPFNIKEAYKSLYKQVSDYLFSSEFRSAAKKMGVSIASVASVDEEIVPVRIEKRKNKTVAEIIAERKRAKEPTVEVEEPTVEVEEPTVEVEEPTVEVKEPTVEIEKPIEKTDVITIGDLFGVAVKGEKSGEIIGADKFSMMLAYGSTDYILGMFEDSNGYHYRLDLPQSLGQVVISFDNSTDNGRHSSILSVWKSYVEDNQAIISLVSRGEDQLEALSNVLGFGGATKERESLNSSELRKERYDADLFTTVNDTNSLSMGGVSYYDISKKVKIGWGAKILLEDYLPLPYGVAYTDYVYTPAQNLYSKGGYTIVAKKYTFFVPKGLTKKNTFAEIGTYLSKPEIDTSKFEKNIEIGKRFQVSTGNFKEALECRIIASKNEVIMLADAAGDSYRISLTAYNYFKHYYGDVSLKISDDTVLALYNDGVIGLIAAEKFSNTEVSGIYDIEEFKTELRSIDIVAFDSMVSEEIEIEEATEVEIEKIESGEESTTGLKEELEGQIDFLLEMYEEAIEDGDNQTLIDELDAQLETLTDLIIEIIEDEIDEASEAEKKVLGKELRKYDKIQKTIQ
tara:strand:+ start:22080 stop:23900 length:1821 start_codon:yes stop_codon:yes gene_type:complete